MKTNPIEAATTQAIGAKFGFILLAEIGAANFEAVATLNAAEKNPEICHSHDFCDANEVMAEAFAAVVGRSIDLQSDADSELWSEAWASYKAAKP